MVPPVVILNMSHRILEVQTPLVVFNPTCVVFKLEVDIAKLIICQSFNLEGVPRSITGSYCR